MDAAKNINKVNLARDLPHLGTRDLVKETTGKKVPATQFRGKYQIGGIWVTKDINCHAARFIPLWSILIYHIECVVYIPYDTLIG